MNFITLLACLVFLGFLLLRPSGSVFQYPHRVSKDILVENSDDFVSLNAIFHSALFPGLDLLQDPVKSHLEKQRGFMTPFTEFTPSDHPEKIMCCPPYSEMALHAEIPGVLHAKTEDLTQLFQSAVERFFRHLIFSFVVSQYRQEHKTHGSLKSRPSPRNSSMFQYTKLASMTGDRCSDLLLLSPDPKNSFSFISTDPNHSIQGIERVIHSNGENLAIKDELVVLALKSVHASLRKQYREARKCDEKTDEAIYLAELSKTLVHLTRTGRIHATDGNRLYTRIAGTIDERCFLWLPRELESWSFVNAIKNQTGIYSFSVDQTSLFAEIQSEIIQAFDYGDQIEMLDVLPIGQGSTSGVQDEMENMSSDAFFEYLKLPKSLDDFRALTSASWDIIQEYSENEELMCKEKIHRSTSGLSGNFCYSGPPSAPLRILLSKKHNNVLDDESERINEEMRAQYVSELNSPTMEIMGFEFENVPNQATEEDRALDQPSLNVLRRHGACNVDISEELRQQIVEIWRRGIRDLKASHDHAQDVDLLDAVTNYREFMKRLSRFELVCPCRMAVKGPTRKEKSRFFP